MKKMKGKNDVHYYAVLCIYQLVSTCAKAVSCAVLSQPSEQCTSTATPLCNSSATKAAPFIIWKNRSSPNKTWNYKNKTMPGTIQHDPIQNSHTVQSFVIDFF